MKTILSILLVASLGLNVYGWYVMKEEPIPEAPTSLESDTVDMQSEFALDVAIMIMYANDLGYKVTLGEASRTRYQQLHNIAIGVSWTMNSNHLRRRALDIQIYDKDGKYMMNKEPYQVLGEYFMSLREGNVWGGTWKNTPDYPHYERRY